MCFRLIVFLACRGLSMSKYYRIPSLLILTILSFQKNIPFLRRYPSTTIELSYSVLILPSLTSSCASLFLLDGEFWSSLSVLPASVKFANFFPLIKRGVKENFSGVARLCFEGEVVFVGLWSGVTLPKLEPYLVTTNIVWFKIFLARSLCFGVWGTSVCRRFSHY